nr:MAG TPA: hypothetical protein [Caudoviricetes sp.]
MHSLAQIWHNNFANKKSCVSTGLRLNEGVCYYESYFFIWKKLTFFFLSKPK